MCVWLSLFAGLIVRACGCVLVGVSVCVVHWLCFFFLWLGPVHVCVCCLCVGALVWLSVSLCVCACLFARLSGWLIGCLVVCVLVWLLACVVVLLCGCAGLLVRS